MTDLALLRKNGRYLACVSFTGSMLDAEVISVSVGGVSPWSKRPAYAGGYSFCDPDRFNEAFMPVFEGTAGYSLSPTGIAVVYGVCEKRKGLGLGTEGAHVMGKFLSTSQFELFNEALGALPCLRAMKTKVKGWTAYLLETDEDIQTTLSMHEHVSLRRDSNTWVVFQGESGEFFLSNQLNRAQDEGEPVGLIITEKGFPCSQEIKVALGTTLVDTAKQFSAHDALSCIQARA